MVGKGGAINGERGMHKVGKVSKILQVYELDHFEL